MQLSTLNESTIVSESIIDLCKKYIGKTSNGLLVYTIEPEYFRTYFDVDYADGGHHYAYPRIIPKNEIWIDNTLNERDRKGILVHEMVEFMLMAYFKMTYAQAHRFANKIEHLFRSKFRIA